MVRNVDNLNGYCAGFRDGYNWAIKRSAGNRNPKGKNYNAGYHDGFFDGFAWAVAPGVGIGY